MYHLKKSASKVRLAPQGLQKAFAHCFALNNYKFMVHHVLIYRKRSKDFNKEKKPITF